MLRRLVLGFLVVSLVAVALVAHAEMQFNEKHEQYWLIWNECDPVPPGFDSLIDAKAEVHMLYAVTKDSNGGRHYKFHMNMKLSGEGIHFDWMNGVRYPTGVTYKGRGVYDNSYNSKPGAATNETWSEKMQLRGSDGSKITMVWKGHVTINANGEFVVEHWEYEIVCKEKKPAPSKGDTVTTKWGKIKSQY
jgi:hypothetical protein